MRKKTTIYIDKSELDALKTLSIVQNTSVTELIRLGVRQVCDSASQEEMKVMKMLSTIKKNRLNKGCSSQGIMNLAVKAQREVRNERKKKNTRRS